MAKSWDIAVYIITNKPYGTLYVGVTSNLRARITEHRNGRFEGFSKRYGVSRLVWFERFTCIREAIRAEKSLKRYLRD